METTELSVITQIYKIQELGWEMAMDMSKPPLMLTVWESIVTRRSRAWEVSFT